MKAPKLTQGEWEWRMLEIPEENGAFPHISNGNEMLARLYDTINGGEEEEANAKMMTASKKMAEALEWIYLETWNERGKVHELAKATLLSAGYTEEEGDE